MTPTRDSWRELIGPALRIVDGLPGRGYGVLDVRMGGGTVLMFRLDHRISKDIDLFFDDAQALGFLTPRLNDDAAAVATGYQEQSNAIKLLLVGGDVDFIVAGSVLREPATEAIDVGGRRLMLESTAEILAKKLLYRAATLKARDVFDLAAALALDPDSARKAIAAAQPLAPVLLRRLEALRRLDASSLTFDLLLTETGRELADGMVSRVAQAIAS